MRYSIIKVLAITCFSFAGYGTAFFLLCVSVELGEIVFSLAECLERFIESRLELCL